MDLAGSALPGYVSEGLLGGGCSEGGGPAPLQPVAGPALQDLVAQPCERHRYRRTRQCEDRDGKRFGGFRKCARRPPLRREHHQRMPQIEEIGRTAMRERGGPYV